VGEINAYRILVHKLPGEQPTGKKWEDNIKMDLRDMRCKGWRWMELAQDCVQW
jgi:hypothetical protein